MVELISLEILIEELSIMYHYLINYNLQTP